MASVVTTPTGEKYVVKNLGWLVRHSGKSLATAVYVNPLAAVDPLGAQVLQVTFEDGYVYVTDFASPRILWDWLHARRNLRSVTLYWHGTPLVL